MVYVANVIVCAIFLASCSKENKSEVNSENIQKSTTGITWTDLSSQTNGAISSPPAGFEYQHPEWLSTSTVYLVDETNVGGSLMEVYVFNSSDDLQSARSGGNTVDRKIINDGKNSCGGCTFECRELAQECYVVEVDDGHVVVTCE